MEDVKAGEKLACITLDYETDYGDRVGAFNILEENKAELHKLAELFRKLETPVSSFIRTDLLDTYQDSLQNIKDISVDFHCHSHTHDTKAFNSKSEIRNTVQAFQKHFGYKPIGYRAPQGVLYENDIDLLKKHGIKFSSSVFPSYRPGKYNNLSMPCSPYFHENGVMELPFAVIPKLRYTISLSYLKLLGFNINRMFSLLFGLPNVLIFDSHLHDYIVNETSFNHLPSKIAMAYGINKNQGVPLFTEFVSMLRKKGYRFITMTELYERMKERKA